MDKVELVALVVSLVAVGASLVPLLTKWVLSFKKIGAGDGLVAIYRLEILAADGHVSDRVELNPRRESSIRHAVAKVKEAVH